MRRVLSLMLALFLVLSVTTVAVAKKKRGEKPGVVVADAVVLKATVEAIDHVVRTITLKGPQGVAVTFKVDPSVKNFDQVQKGDKVVARYLDSIAIYVEKAKGKPTAEATSAVEVAPRGKKPAGISVKVTEIKASVEAINYRKRTLTLKGPEGKTLTFKADKRVKNLREIKSGDEIVVRHTEALAISVEK
jgi:hypothetical protein